MLMIFPSVRKDHSSKRKKASKIEMYSIIPRFVLFVLLLYISKEREKLRLVNDFAGDLEYVSASFPEKCKSCYRKSESLTRMSIKCWLLQLPLLS